ncbi:MAG: hypothetical protein AVDCRST_MAG72-2094 [uncultured Nocardioidaceae bacterium]|uniref:Uncharacterized protein n=1 Tax=uncultured Nocardioidaceae bacterium TaxID=253824 RepID=A0A6J4MIK7_9ACTN|nr:MAG: hypothetical protein AVDCRST_MAG72-2094 [uncultured Nocardioidaceae bacterium]
MPVVASLRADVSDGPVRSGHNVPMERAEPASQPVPERGRAAAAVRLLRSRGSRVTQPRRAVLEVLDAAKEEHLNADDIANRAAESAPGLHRATVYRALATLGDLGIVAHTHVGGAATVYHLADSPDRAAPHLEHGHLQCTTCGRVLDVNAELLDPLARKLRDAIGFQLAVEHAALLGTCAVCLDQQRFVDGP